MHLGAKLRNTCTVLNTCSLLALWLPSPCLIWTILELENIPYQKYWLWISGFRIMFFCLDPDSDFKFLWIRIRFLNFSGFGSSFQISLDPDTDPVRGWIRIRFVLRGWIRIQSISDRIRNPGQEATTTPWWWRLSIAKSVFLALKKSKWMNGFSTCQRLWNCISKALKIFSVFVAPFNI